ncbi:MAG: translational GTPase TypA, partial [Okeania sp. SIO3B3]|nr:translational GTPase TypA [Okeania sp. SIO3B3]
EMLGKRRGEMQEMQDSSSGNAHMTFIVPTRGLLGFRYQFLTATRGNGIMNTIFHGYDKLAGLIHSRARGSLVAWETGPATTHGIKNAEERGILFLAPGVDVYEGMVVGEHQRPGDLDVNICKTKQLTNMRQAFRDVDSRLTPPRVMSLDEAIEYMVDDELLEVTPTNLRIRKRILDRNQRAKETKRTKEAMSAA